MILPFYIAEKLIYCLFQFPGDGLYVEYINNFDKWLRSKLIASSKIPASRYLFASLALNNSLHEWDVLSLFVLDLGPKSDRHTLRLAALLHGGEGNPRYANRTPGPNAPDLPIYQFFWDRGRAREFYPQKSWFIDLARSCLLKASAQISLDKTIILVTLQRIISHLPMEREIFKLLLKSYRLPEPLLLQQQSGKNESEYEKAFISIKQFMSVGRYSYFIIQSCVLINR